MLLLLFLTYTLTTVDRAILNVLLQPIKQELLLSDTQAGFIVGIAFGLFFVVACIPLGVLSDRWNRRNIIGICILAWSGMTAFCGMAQNFWQMTLGRIGVAVGEAGAPPAAVALIADIFPESHRARAIALFYLGAPAGALITGIVASLFAAHYGWRTAFFAASLPGIVLGAIIFLTVREPLRAPRSVGPKFPPIAEALRFIIGQRSLCYSILAMAIAHLVNTGVMVFMTAYMMRSHGMSLSRAGISVALFNAITMAISLYSGGWLADRLAQRDIRWRCRISTVSFLFALVLLPAMVLSNSEPVVLVLLAVWTISAVLHITPTLALGQFLARSDMRATVSATHFVLGTGIGGALGPFLAGMLSDAYAPAFGIDSLRYAFLTLVVLYIPAILLYVRAEKTLVADMRRAAEG